MHLFILNLFQWFQGWNQQKTFENEQKINQKRQIQGTPSGSRAAFACQPAEITEKGLKWIKKVKNGFKKVVQPAFGCTQHPKADRNTQHTVLTQKEKFRRKADKKIQISVHIFAEMPFTSTL